MRLFGRKGSYRETARCLGLARQEELFFQVSTTTRSPKQAKTHDDDLAEHKIAFQPYNAEMLRRSRPLSYKSYTQSEPLAIKP